MTTPPPFGRPEAFERFRAALADRYAIEREAGRGAMATVYLARDLKHGRHVAIKVLHEDYVTAVGAERFLREIETAARLQHPHIVGVYDSGEAAGLLYYVMPYIEGETLRELLNRETQLSIGEAIRIARHVADALAHAHIHGIVHRDIKPENILLGSMNASVADFGIAKAIHSAGEAKLTSSGLSAGTPAYMSPEQASGDRDIDGRSDVYSLGCVLFEMLAGVPPYHGANAHAVLTRHITEPPPKIRSFRNSVSPALERVLVRAMAKVAADRYSSAGEFEAALVAALAAPDVRTIEPRNRAKWTVASLAVLAAAIVALVVTLRRGPAQPFADSIAVLPFDHAETGDTLLDGDNSQVMLHDALARWQGVRLINTYQLNDARAQRGYERLTSESRFAMARKMGAQHAVWGHVRDAGGAIEVRAAIYEVSKPRASAREYAVRLERDYSDAEKMFGILADSLVATTVEEGGVPPRGAMQTTNRDALRAYFAAHKALTAWDVRRASKEFQRAAEIDPEYASAHLWHAQTMSWTSDTIASWRTAAKRAASLKSKLAEREQVLADGLLALATAEFPAACERFAELVASDSADFAAWYGLGECHRRDELVIRAGNPVRWHFRASYHAAAQAYREALERVPAAHLAFRETAPERLTQLLYAENNRLRRGYILAPDTILFAAYPAWDSDTLAFFPASLGDIASMRPGTEPSEKALAYTRGILQGIAEEWTRTFPSSSIAHATVGRVLESTARPDQALRYVRAARRFATDSLQRVRLAAAETRLLIKTEQFAQARALADSVLLHVPLGSAIIGDSLAGLAALTGRTALAAAHMQTTAGQNRFATSEGRMMRPPRPIAGLVASLDAYSAAGAPADRIDSLAKSIIALLPRYYSSRKDIAAAREAYLRRAMLAAYSTIGKSALGYGGDAGDVHTLLQTSHSRGDSASVRRILADLRGTPQRRIPGGQSMEFVLPEAMLMLAISDTVAAAAHLDHTLEALPAMGPFLFVWVQEASSFVRSMALRAEIAAKRGDVPTARRWARAVEILWSDADQELQPVVARMRAIARSAG